jgi:hypothetical protein
MNRSFMGPPGVFMADADVPDRFWPAVRLVVNNLVWILPLVAIEQMVAGELSRAVYLGIVFVIDLVVAVKWGLLETLFGKAGRMGTIQLTLLAGGDMAISDHGVSRHSMDDLEFSLRNSGE